MSKAIHSWCTGQFGLVFAEGGVDKSPFRVPAVYLTSAFLAILADLSERRMNNLSFERA